jgi:phage baseplate assembly protein gpV
VRALIALARPYQPTIGDRVVVVGDGEARFVVGIIERQAAASLYTGDGSRAELTADGALEVRDARGQLRVRYDGDETTVVAASGDLVLDAPEGGVVVRAKTDVAIEAPRIRLEAEQLFEKTRESVREVSSLLLTRAGRMRSLVREGYNLMAHRTHIKSEKDTSIDGKRILLG